MKKAVLLISFIIVFSLNLLGYYSSENMIDMLVHSNQLRIRTDRLGALFGNRNIRAVIGLTGANVASGTILNNLGDQDSLSDNKSGIEKFIPALLVGIGYDSDIFGIALGYEFKYTSPFYMVHTPILHITALNDNFRINIPVSIGAGSKSIYNTQPNNGRNLEGTLVVSTGIEARYYFNQPYFSHIRVYFNYGNATIKEINNPNISFTQQSVGFQARAYFRYELPYNMVLEPIIRVQFDTALATKYRNYVNDQLGVVDNVSITAKGFIPSDTLKTFGQEGSGGANADITRGSLKGGYIASIPTGYYAEQPYRIGVALPLGLRAASETGLVEFYLEPALSFTILNAKNIYTSDSASLPDQYKVKRNSPFYTLGYVVYGELYIRPIPQLEWYTELQTGGSTIANGLNGESSTSLVFNAATGITWYF